MRKSVNYVTSRLEKIKSKMEDKSFLLSNSYRLYLEKIARGISGNYKLKVVFGQGVHTNGQVITVNPIHPYVMKIKELSQKTLCVLGQLSHELLHILYTDFKTLSFLKDKYEKQGVFRFSQVKELLNIVEDAAIELVGINYYTGLIKQALLYNNENAFENLPSLDELQENDSPRLSVIKMACAMYCILGKMKGELQDPYLLELFEQIMPLLDEARLSKDTWERLKYAERIYKILLPLIEEVEKQRKEDEANSSFKYTKNTEISHGQGECELQEAPELKQDFQKSNKEETKKEISKKLKELKQEEIEDEENQGGDTSNEDVQEDNASENSASESSNEESSYNETEANNESDNESEENSSSTEKSQDEEEIKNESDNEEELEDALDRLREQLEQVQEDAAKEEYDKEEQIKRDNEIKEFAKNVEYGCLHKDIKVEIERKFEVHEKHIAKYKEDFEIIKGITRNLTNQLVDLIKYNEEAKTSGLYSGKLNTSKLYRSDKKVFYQRKDKSDEANLAICLLIDQSGSMDEGGRIVHARIAAMMLYEVCKSLNIPIAIIGHTAVYQSNRVQHRHFVDFDSKDVNEKYKLLNIITYDNTREGVSIKYAGEYLAKRPEEDKILISISDGEPYHSGRGNIYVGDIAKNDTGRVVKEIERKGIKVFGVAIGDGKSSIKNIYTKNFIDVSNIKLLPSKLISLISKNILK